MNYLGNAGIADKYSTLFRSTRVTFACAFTDGNLMLNTWS